VAALNSISEEEPDTKIAIDLKSQTISCEKINLKEAFDIHPFKKQCLMEGVDETQYLINLRQEIIEFEELKKEIA
ncbi:MAG: hypothetical protein AAFY41_11560, partial [Bacteroidota bacterium]